MKTQLEDFISYESVDKPRVKPGNVDNYLEYIEQMSDYDDPNMFGLNDNAQKTYLMKITSETLACILQLQPQ